LFKKSIFSQLFFYTMLVISLSLLVMGVLMYGLLGNYIAEYKEDDLTYVAKSLAEFTLKVAERNPGYAKESYQMNVDALSVSTETLIVVLNAKGDKIAVTSGYENVNIRPEYYTGVMQGQPMQHMGTLGGVFKTTTLTVGVPIQYDDSTIGGVFVSLPMPEIQRLRTGVFTIFIFSGIFVFIVALLMVYTMSVRITKPLKALNNASKAIANGQFERRVSLSEENEIGELGDSFNKMAESLEHLEDMRSSFIANVSHDLRTPMTTISGFVGGILDGTIPPEKQDWYLSIVLDETKRLSRLVTDLLDVSKIEQGNFKPELRELDINELIRLTIIKSEKRIMDKDIQLTVNFQSDNQRVMADKDAIQRVLTNLLDNAIKFTEEGGFLDIRTGTTERNKVFVSIQNSGIGIDKDDLIHIFDRFYKSDKSRSLDKKGTGLGLYIVKNIMLAHGETVWAESEPDSYTRFTFTLSQAPPAKRNEKNNA